MSEVLKWEPRNPINFDRQDFDQFLRWAHSIDASDIMIEGDNALALKYEGQMINVSEYKVTVEELSQILTQIDQPSATSQLVSGEPLDFPYALPIDNGDIIRFRVNATAGKGVLGADFGIEMVLRTIPSAPPTTDQLKVEQEIIDGCDSKYGIVLVTGPTGSGKTTLIGALLRRIIEKFKKHILTYEAPIEFDLKAIPKALSKVFQSEVPDHVKTFDMAISNALRRAPDIILIGEARDKDTIAGCIRASQTGHLVFTTVHTNNVSMTISRMADEFEPAERKGQTSKLVDAVRMIVHQRLVPKLGGGRIPLKEYLVFSEEDRRNLQMRLFEVDDIGSDIQKLVESKGMSLVVDAKKKLREGLISCSTYSTVVRDAGNPEDLSEILDIHEGLSEMGIVDPSRNEWVARLKERAVA